MSHAIREMQPIKVVAASGHPRREIQTVVIVSDTQRNDATRVYRFIGIMGAGIITYSDGTGFGKA